MRQVKKWASTDIPAAMRPQTENYVVSRYIEDPLLIGGKKFDLRIYVVVLNYKPLQVFARYILWPCVPFAACRGPCFSKLETKLVPFTMLQVYMSQLGFARFCNIKYSSEVAEMDNQFVHLTNVAIQKHGDEYNSKHGNKWPLTDLRLYLEVPIATLHLQTQVADHRDTAALCRWRAKSLSTCINGNRMADEWLSTMSAL